MAAFCKRKGFVYPAAEIYGGLAGFFDYGPLGVELKNNIKSAWWKTHVHNRTDVAGIDGSIITNPQVWVASGHVANFSDLMLTTKKSKTKVRADQFIEDQLKVPADGMSAEEINNLVKEHKLKLNGEDFEEVKDFNLMFETNVGPVSGSSAYLRPETAQSIFPNFRLVQENARMKLPFGIAQIGKAFRNEISPRDFLFRCREFEQMELEYFVHPNEVNKCPYINEVKDVKVQYVSAYMQEKDEKEKSGTIAELLKQNIITSEWQAYWLATEHEWFANLGANMKKFRLRQHVSTEKSHYAVDTWDLEYNFPFGWKELQGIANRGDYDLKQHQETSKKELSYFDQESKEKVLPHVVAEPSQGVDRAFLVFLFDAYDDKDKRGFTVLKLHRTLAPYKVAVFPLLSNKPELVKKATEVFETLRDQTTVFFDKTGAIGRRYARQDEIGTPLGITIDFDTLEDGTVTIRDRDTTKQVRAKIDDLQMIVMKYLQGASFDEIL